MAFEQNSGFMISIGYSNLGLRIQNFGVWISDVGFGIRDSHSRFGSKFQNIRFKNVDKESGVKKQGTRTEFQASGIKNHVSRIKA